MAAFTDDTSERQAIYMPKEAILEWKKALNGEKYPANNFPPNWINICLSFSFASLATTLAMFVCLLVDPFDKHLGGILSSNYLSAAFTIFVATCVISAILAFRIATEAENIGHQSGYSKGVRTMILYGTNHDGIDPDDCDVEGNGDTFTRKYLIVVKEQQDDPPPEPTVPINNHPGGVNGL